MAAIAIGAFAWLPAGAAASPESKPFGIAKFTMQATEEPAGSSPPPAAGEPQPFTQAGGHPFALISTIEFSSEVNEKHVIVPTEDPKDVVIDLPPGLVADPHDIASCPQAIGQCPTDSQVGVFVLEASFEGFQLTFTGPIVNMTPGEEHPAELGLEIRFGEAKLGRALITGGVVRTPQGYGLAIAATELPAIAIVSIQTTLWGVPAAASHDAQRGMTCIGTIAEPQESCEGGGVPSGAVPAPFLTLGSDCTGDAQTAGLFADSREQPGQYLHAQTTLPALTGCNALPFGPELRVAPDTVAAQAPLGLDVNIAAPPDEGAVSAPDLRTASVTLPAGVAINPGAGNGLQACPQGGPEGIDLPTGLNAAGEPLTPAEAGEGEVLEEGLFGPALPRLAAGHCPAAATIGTVRARTPLLSEPLEGRVYMAAPECGGPGRQACTNADAADGNAYRIYIELGGAAEPPRPYVGSQGVVIKAQGEIAADPATGQLTVELSELPQLPLSELSIELFGGEGALLANPEQCGEARTTSELAPWSAPETPTLEPTSYYVVSGCRTQAEFHPKLIAGSENLNAGTFTPFTIQVERGAGEQDLAGLQVATPPGLSAMLASVPPCQEPAAGAGECPAGSRIGESIAAAGAGGDTGLLQLPGEIYLTSGYDGAPYGLSIVTTAAAGPLNLGEVVIRAQIEIDPHTGALTIASGPLPQVLLGVPLRVRSLALRIDRPNFVLNPTSCAERQIAATVTGAEGTSAQVGSRFQLAECARLKFAPAVSASTSGHASLATGASLDVRLAFGPFAAGTSANLAGARIELPKQLPARLTALQGACPGATFAAAGPAACPASAQVGSVTARTPLLGAALSGPIYLVSRGRGAPPAPVVVLRGDGTELLLTGATTLGAGGGATIAFTGLPDIPLETLELSLPAGAHSALAAGADLCHLTRRVTAERTVARRIRSRAGGPRRTVRRKVTVHEREPAPLLLQTVLSAQNGAVREQSTDVDVTGCPRGMRTRLRAHTSMKS